MARLHPLPHSPSHPSLTRCPCPSGALLGLWADGWTDRWTGRAGWSADLVGSPLARPRGRRGERRALRVSQLMGPSPGERGYAPKGPACPGLAGGSRGLPGRRGFVCAWPGTLAPVPPCPAPPLPTTHDGKALRLEQTLCIAGLGQEALQPPSTAASTWDTDPHLSSLLGPRVRPKGCPAQPGAEGRGCPRSGGGGGAWLALWREPSGCFSED